jgi:hypothetical protein
MSELINQIHSRRGVGTEPDRDDKATNDEFVSALPAENLREADLELGVLFNG